MIFTTSKYEENGFADIISSLVKIYRPKVVVELGTQQGSSSILIAKALRDGHIYTFDLFEDNYNQQPYAETHANFIEACKNVCREGVADRVTIVTLDAFKVYKHFDNVDMLHVDLCNYHENMEIILRQWYKKVNKVIILEGGGYNKWQREKGFLPFYPLLDTEFITTLYDKIIIEKNIDYALTILQRKN